MLDCWARSHPQIPTPARPFLCTQTASLRRTLRIIEHFLINAQQRALSTALRGLLASSDVSCEPLCLRLGTRALVNSTGLGPGCRCGADRPALVYREPYPPAPPDPDPDLVVRLYVVVDDGPLRPGVAWVMAASWASAPM